MKKEERREQLLKRPISCPGPEEILPGQVVTIDPNPKRVVGDPDDPFTVTRDPQSISTLFDPEGS